MPNNAQILDYLAYYAAFEQAPRFAVLIDGRWGIGKTYLIETFLASVRTTEFQAVYVSLNGLKASAEIDRELFRASYEVLGNKFFEAATGLAKTGLKWWQGISLDIDFLRLVNRYKADFYVFDDLERCDMPIAQVLGYINAFVEHGGRKVVIIANEGEIADQENYRRTREKVVGMTLVVEPAIDAALAAFLNGIRDRKIQALLQTKIDVIRTIHEQAELDNLRILQQGLWDVERFFAALEDRHRQHDAAMTTMLRLILTLSIEVRAGRLREADLRDRRVSIVLALMDRDKAGPPTALGSARHRYPSSDLGSTVLADDTLIALLTKGTVDATAIRRDLDASVFFVDPGNEPAWRTLWDGLDRTDDEVAAAQHRMEAEFAERAYTAPGVILHVFGQRIHLCRIGALALSKEQVVAECRGYVDDLYAQGRLEPAPLGHNPTHREPSYGGLGVAAAETGEYKSLAAYLAEMRARVSVDSYAGFAAGLLDRLRTDPEQFLDEIASDARQSGRFRRVPVLARIDPADFVAALLSLHPKMLREVLEALGSRYQSRNLTDELSVERPWALAVSAGLAAATIEMPPHGRHRLRSFLAQTLDQVPELASARVPKDDNPNACRGSADER